MREPQELLEDTIRRLRAQGYRLTPQRVAILQAVIHSHSHPTAEETYQQVAADFPMISLATVYKTLNVLKDLGEVLELEVDGRNHYDSNVTPHPHLICTKCYGIADLPPEAMCRIPEEALVARGFHALWYDVKIYGLCARCQEQERESR